MQSILLDGDKYDLFERYRALFTLREINNEDAVAAMCQCLTKENKRTCSDLLRHEVAFVIRQMTECYKPAISYFLECLAD